MSHEQVVERGGVECKTPSALTPGLRSVRLVVVAAAAAFWLLADAERRRGRALA